MPAAAYALPSEQRQEQTHVRVVRGGRYNLRRAKRVAGSLMWLAVGVLILLLIVSVIYSQAQVTQLSSQIDTTRQELVNAQSTYDYLSSTMSGITSSANVQQIAEGELGLIHADSSQITYIKLETESVVQKTESGPVHWLDGVRTAALSLFDALDP